MTERPPFALEASPRLFDTFPEPDENQIVGRLSDAMRRWRFSPGREEDLQEGIAKMLDGEQLRYRREESLSRRDRPDFMIWNVALEVKVDGGTMAVLRQLQRYAAHEDVARLVLVTTRSRHASLPASVLGKPLTVLWVTLL